MPQLLDAEAAARNTVAAGRKQAACVSSLQEDLTGKTQHFTPQKYRGPCSLHRAGSPFLTQRSVKALTTIRVFISVFYVIWPGSCLKWQDRVSTIELVFLVSRAGEERMDSSEEGINPAVVGVSSGTLHLKHLITLLYPELVLSKCLPILSCARKM